FFPDPDFRRHVGGVVHGKLRKDVRVWREFRRRARAPQVRNHARGGSVFLPGGMRAALSLLKISTTSPPRPAPPPAPRERRWGALCRTKGVNGNRPAVCKDAPGYVLF